MVQLAQPVLSAIDVHTGEMLRSHSGDTPNINGIHFGVEP